MDINNSVRNNKIQAFGNSGSQTAACKDGAASNQVYLQAKLSTITPIGSALYYLNYNRWGEKWHQQREINYYPRFWGFWLAPPATVSTFGFVALLATCKMMVERTIYVLVSCKEDTIVHCVVLRHLWWGLVGWTEHLSCGPGCEWLKLLNKNLDKRP